MTDDYRSWLDWSFVNQLRQEHSDLDIVDFDELNIGDRFIYRFPHNPRFYIRIQPEGLSAANARSLTDGGKHIITRWENNTVPVVRLTSEKFKDIQDDMNVML